MQANGGTRVTDQQGHWSAPPRPKNTRRLILGVVLLFVVSTLVGTGVGLLNAGRSEADRPVTTSTVTISTVPTTTTEFTVPPSPAVTYTPTEPTYTPTEPSYSPKVSLSPSAPTKGELEQAAYDALKEQAAVDRRQTNVRGQWVAQLSSKYVGVRDRLQKTASGSHKFNAVDILAEHKDVRNRFGDLYDVILLRGQDFGSGKTHNGKTLWYTFVIGNFASRGDVSYFCSSAFPDLTGTRLDDHCLSRRLRP
jgi:hypothetical protein